MPAHSIANNGCVQFSAIDVAICSLVLWPVYCTGPDFSQTCDTCLCTDYYKACLPSIVCRFTGVKSTAIVFLQVVYLLHLPILVVQFPLCFIVFTELFM